MAYTERPRNPDYGLYPGAEEFLGAPPFSGWDEENGRWHPDYEPGQPGDPNYKPPTADPPPAAAPPKNPFDTSKVPSGIPVDWAKSFIASNPGDYHRLASAYGSQRTGGNDTPDGSAAPSPPPSSSTLAPVQSWLQQAPPPAAAPPPPDPYAALAAQQQAAYAAAQQQQNTLLQQMMEQQRQRDTAAAQQEAARKARADELYGTLSGRARQSLDVDANDPIISGQVNNFRNEQTRALRNMQSEASEAGRGMGPAALAVAAERAGTATGGFQSELLARELSSRRAEVANAIASMGGMLSADQQVGLQRELAGIDSAIKQYQLGQGNQGLDLQRELGLGGQNLQRELGFGGLGLQRDLGFGDLNLRNQLGNRGLDLDQLRALLTNRQFYSDLGLRQQQLNSNNDQFTSRLGFDTADRSMYWDALKSGLLSG